MKTVYLAGPIVGCTYSEANDWRDYVAEELMDVHINCISPLRFENNIRDKDKLYPLSSNEPTFGSAKAIGSKNIFDLRASDIVFAYLPKPNSLSDKQSYGTLGEISGGFFLNKGVVLVSNDPDIIEHGLYMSMAGWIVPELDQGILICRGLLEDYG